MNLNFSIYEQPQAINQQLSVIYTPSANTTSYEYEIIRDGQVYQKHDINSNQMSNIVLDSSGVFQIKVIEKNIFGNPQVLESGIYRLDLDEPLIICDSSYFEFYSTDQTYDIVQRVKSSCRAKDAVDGDITLSSNIDTLNLNKIGKSELVYTAVDEAGNVATRRVLLNIVRFNSSTLLFFQSIFFLTFLILAILFLKYKRAANFERRIAKYSVKSTKSSKNSLAGAILEFYKKLLLEIEKIISQSHFFTNYSKKYEKYTFLYKEFYDSELEVVSGKISLSIVSILIALLAKTLQYKLLSIYEVFIPALFGFFLPDLIYKFRYKVYRSKIENDLLQAIIIMNNAFKSGRSIQQAICLVTTELEGDIAQEFKKMELELLYGLEIDVVFDRFSKRIQLDEVNYLTASLSILNKTGGNIIKVFDSIEKSLFNKKKLKLEMASLTGSSKIIVIMLIAIPILFILFISLISPTYFEPFYKTSLGLVLMVIILILYFIYVVMVRKLMKVRM